MPHSWSRSATIPGSELTLEDGTTSPQDLIYTVTPITEEGCDGEDFKVTITVNPTPTMDAPPNIEVCNGEEVVIDFTTENTGGVTTYEWSIINGPEIGLPDSTTDITDSDSDITFTASNPDPDPRVVIVSVTPIFTNNGVECTTSPAETFTITVNPEPQIDDFTETICEGDTFASILPENDTNGVVPSGTIYTWVIADESSDLIIGGSASTTASATIPGSELTLVNDTTSPQDLIYTVTPNTEEGCEGEPFTVTITVNPTAQVNQPENLTLCNGDTAEIDFTTLNQGGDTTYVWQVVLDESDDIGPITNQGSDQGNINLAVENNTFDVLTATIEVIPTYTNNGEQCEGPSKEFTISVLPTAQVQQVESFTVCNGDEINEIVFETLIEAFGDSLALSILSSFAEIS